jgi:hypothetical protein
MAFPPSAKADGLHAMFFMKKYITNATENLQERFLQKK